MATLNNVRPELRRHASGVPAPILAKLTAAELQARCEEAARLHDVASHSQADHARYLTGQAQRVLRAKPVAEFVHRDRELNMLASSASRQVSRNQDGNLYSVAGAYEAARRAHRDEHRYPAGLVEAIDAAMLGRTPVDPELYELVRQITGGTAA